MAPMYVGTIGRNLVDYSTVGPGLPVSTASIVVYQKRPGGGTEFTAADELFFESIQEDASRDEQVRDAALANTMENFQYVFNKRLNDIVVERMEQNEGITERFLNDDEFQKAIATMLMKRVYEQVREEAGVS